MSTPIQPADFTSNTELVLQSLMDLRYRLNLSDSEGSGLPPVLSSQSSAYGHVVEATKAVLRALGHDPGAVEACLNLGGNATPWQDLLVAINEAQSGQ